MKRKAISRILAISLSVAMCAQSIPIYAAEEIGTSAAADFFAEDSIENQSLNEGDAETNTETNTETNAETNTESNTETNTKADATTGISEAYTLEESNSATTSEETVTDEDGFWSGESETVESSANGSGGWESAEMDGAEAGDEAVKRDAAAFVSGDVEENVEETGETNELEEALSESAEMTEGDFSYVIVNNSYARITRYSGSATSVRVPSTIGGYAVQVIGREHSREIQCWKVWSFPMVLPPYTPMHLKTVPVSPAYICQTASPHWAIKSLEAAAILSVPIIR